MDRRDALAHRCRRQGALFRLVTDTMILRTNVGAGPIDRLLGDLLPWM